MAKKLLTVQDALRVVISQGSNLRIPVQVDMLGLVHRPSDIHSIEATEISFEEDENQE